MRSAGPAPRDDEGGRRRGLVTPYLFSSLQGYRASFVLPDLLAAATLLVIAVPEQLATSRLAGMPPITGFYAFIAGSLCFALFGTNRQLSVGADSTIAPLFAVGVAHLAPLGSARYVDLVGVLAVAVGVLVALVGLLRLGWVANFLSTPIITGFLAGVAVIIVVHQLPNFLGLSSPSGSTVHRIAYLAEHLPSANSWSVAIGLGVLALVVGAERLDRRIPAALFGLVASTALVAIAGLRRHGVAVLGRVPRTPPRFALVGLSWSSLAHLMPLAAVVALVVISQTAATTRAFAAKDGSPTNVNLDFAGVGAGSILAGLSGSFPVNASPPRTAAVVASGGRTQAAALGAAAVLALMIPAARLLTDVPLATLAAVLFYVAGRIVRVRDLLGIARFSRLELALAAIGLLTVALVGVEQGIAVAVGLAILDRARLSARPQLHVLGRVPGTTSFAPLSSDEKAVAEPGVLVVLFATPLWYANALHFRDEMEDALGRADPALRGVILDAAGMSDLDYTGLLALRQVIDDLERRHLPLLLARAGSRVRTSLERGGVAARLGPGRFFGTVGQAVESLRDTDGS